MPRASYKRQKELRRLILDFFEKEYTPYAWKNLLEKAKKEGISGNTLSKYLKEFVEEGLIVRKVDIESTPPKVFYIRRPISPFERILSDLEKPISEAQLLEKIKKIAEEVYDKDKRKMRINITRSIVGFYFEVLKLFIHCFRGAIYAKTLEDGIAFAHHLIYDFNIFKNLIDSQIMLLWQAKDKDMVEDALFSTFLNLFEPYLSQKFLNELRMQIKMKG
jgi:hypothetical protein